MVEFALIVPILLMLVGGIIDFGFYLNAQISMQAGAREGARAAALGKAPGPVALDSLGHLSFIEDLAVAGAPCGTDDTNSTVTVTGSYTFFFAGILGIPSLDLDATAEMRCET